MSKMQNDFKPFIYNSSIRSTRMEQTGVINIQKVPQIKMIRSKMPVTKKESHLLQWLSKTDLK